MLRKRVIGILPLRDDVVVQSFGFARWLPVGAPEISAEYLDRWGIDEIVLVDIGASARGDSIDPLLVERTARRCGVPLAVGGGVSSVAQARDLLKAGADKIVLNTAAVENPTLIQAIADAFGEQCVIIAIDTVRNGYGRLSIRSAKGTFDTGPASWLRQAQQMGAGECLLQAVDRDGMRTGLDLEMARELASFARIPLIVASGIGHPRHVLEGLELDGIQAVAVDNFLFHTEHSVTMLKAWLRRSGCDVRLDTPFDYRQHDYDARGRLRRLGEEATTQRWLERLEARR